MNKVNKVNLFVTGDLIEQESLDKSIRGVFWPIPAPSSAIPMNSFYSIMASLSWNNLQYLYADMIGYLDSAELEYADAKFKQILRILDHDQSCFNSMGSRYMILFINLASNLVFWAHKKGLILGKKTEPSKNNRGVR